jgi:hypothetical protein
VCLPGLPKSEPERLFEVEAAIEQTFSAIAKAQPEGVRSVSTRGAQADQESRSRLTEALLV